MLLPVTAETFDAIVLQSDAPVLIDFWAPWCVPCRALTPQVERVARENASVLRTVSVDVEANPTLAQAYGVSQIPTMLVFVKGQIVARKHGAAGGYGALKLLVKPFVEAA